jgi:hypothetical protein
MAAAGSSSAVSVSSSCNVTKVEEVVVCETSNIAVNADVSCGLSAVSSACGAAAAVTVSEPAQVVMNVTRSADTTEEESLSPLDVTDFLATTHTATIIKTATAPPAKLPPVPAPAPAAATIPVPIPQAPLPPPLPPQGSAPSSSGSAASVDAQSAKPRWRRFDPSELYSEEHFHVSRIQLDGPPFYHRKYWDTVVMPRLRQFRDAVAVMRSDDSLRYAYLMSPPEAKMLMLQNLCPYFDI